LLPPKGDVGLGLDDDRRVGGGEGGAGECREGKGGEFHLEDLKKIRKSLSSKTNKPF
jgi:hypothetical protein